MTVRQPLTTFGLTVRLVIDFAVLVFVFWGLTADVAARDHGWIVFDAVLLAVTGWLTFADVHNWKDPSPRFVPVRRHRP